MKYTKFVESLRYLTDTNSAILEDNTIVLLMNMAKETIVSRINYIQEDYFVFPQTTNLIAGQREYAFPEDIMNHVKKVEIDINNSGKYKPIDEIDVSQVGGTDEDSIKKNFVGKICYDINRKALTIFSGDDIIDVSAGLKIYAPAYPSDYIVSDLTSELDMSSHPSTTSSGIPRPFHQIMLDMCIDLYKYKSETVPQARVVDMERSIKEALKNLRKFNSERTIVPPLRKNIGYDS